jgi:hypothetical protein
MLNGIRGKLITDFRIRLEVAAPCIRGDGRRQLLDGH